MNPMAPERSLQEALEDPAILRDLVDNPKDFRFRESVSLVVCVETYQPHVTLVENDLPAGHENFGISGPMANLLQILATSLNFTYTLTRPPDGAWGTRAKDGSWSGMVGVVARKEADLALGPFGLSESRAQVVDFTTPILIDYVRILARRGRPEVNPWGFVFPLAPEVWACTVAGGALVLAALFLLSRCVRRVARGDAAWSADIYFDYLRVFLQQDRLEAFTWGWERLMFASWLIVTLLLTRSYSGNLMSLLAVRYVPLPFQALRDLLDAPGTVVVWEANTAYVQFFRATTSGQYREMADLEGVGRLVFRKSTEFIDTLDTLVRSGTHALIVEDLTTRILMGEDFSRTGRCDFYASREFFLPFIFAMIGQKRSPLVAAVNERIKAVTEAGLYAHWLQVAIPNSTACVHPPTKITVNSSLSLFNIWGMFMVLFIGLFIAAVVFCAEVFFVARFPQMRGTKKRHSLAGSYDTQIASSVVM